MREKILKLLGQGLSVTTVAGAVGCDPSYVSQLLGEDAFALEVAELRCASLEAVTNRDGKYDNIEDLLLKKLEDVLPFMLKPRDILDALTRVNAAKRRGAPAILNGTDLARTTIIALQLPNVIIQAFRLNADNEVVEVGARALVNMPAASLMKSLEQRSAKDASALETEVTSYPRVPNLTVKQAERSIITEDSV